MGGARRLAGHRPQRNHLPQRAPAVLLSRFRSGAGFVPADGTKPTNLTSNAANDVNSDW